MQAALGETDRRRAIQLAYNEEHGITAASIVKGISDIAEFLQGESKTPKGKRRSERKRVKTEAMTSTELEKTIVELEEEMLAAAEDLRFEYAARLRDEIRELRRDLRQLTDIEAPASDQSRRRPSSSLTAWRRRRRLAAAVLAERCRSGTAARRATCRGGARATRTRSSSPRSCCSRRRSRGSSRATRPGWSAGRRRRRWRRAPVAEVLAAWVGLGYNRRALRLREACARRGATAAGPTTCGRCRASGRTPPRRSAPFAFGRDELPVDTNVRRVAGADGLRAAAQTPPELGQALMELGRRGLPRARARRCDGLPGGGVLRVGGRGGGRAARSRRRWGRRERFEDSNRWVRGRVVAALAAGDRAAGRDRAGAAGAGDRGARARRPGAARGRGAQPSELIARRSGRGASDRQVDPLGFAPWPSTVRPSRSATSPSAGAATSPRRSTRTWRASPRRSRSCDAGRGRRSRLRRRPRRARRRSPRPPPSRCGRSSRPPSPARRRSSAARRTRRDGSATRPSPTRARRATRPSPRARSTSARSARRTTQMLQRVDAMESELGALVECLRTGANRLTADLSLLEGGMGELYDAAGRTMPRRARLRRRRRAPPRPCRRRPPSRPTATGRSSPTSRGR